MTSAYPYPLTGKSGWPWTKEFKPLPPTLSDGSPWPKINVIIPYLNKA